MVNRHTKFEVSTITCNEDIKADVKNMQNSRFEPPFGVLRGHAQGSPMARRKAHCDFLLVIIELFFASCHD